MSDLYYPEPPDWVKEKMAEVNRKRELLVGYENGKIVNRRERDKTRWERIVKEYPGSELEDRRQTDQILAKKVEDEWPTPDVKPFKSPIKYKNRKPVDILEMSYLSKQLD